MSEIVVWGIIPVGIHVDTDNGEVIRVVAIDEELRYPKDIDTPVMEGDLAVSTEGYQKPWGALDVGATGEEIEAVREESRKALAFATGDSGIWPAWEWGY